MCLLCFLHTLALDGHVQHTHLVAVVHEPCSTMQPAHACGKPPLCVLGMPDLPSAPTSQGYATNPGAAAGCQWRAWQAAGLASAASAAPQARLKQGARVRTYSKAPDVRCLQAPQQLVPVWHLRPPRLHPPALQLVERLRSCAARRTSRSQSRSQSWAQSKIHCTAQWRTRASCRLEVVPRAHCCCRQALSALRSARQAQIAEKTRALQQSA